MLHRTSLRTLVVAVGLLCGLPAAYPSGQPDGIAMVQTVLREEQLYAGKITGVLDAETESAIRHYQIVHGLRVTGRLDNRTRSAMSLPETPAPASVIEQDREFLHRVAAPKPPPVAETNSAQEQKAPSSAAPERSESQPGRAPKEPAAAHSSSRKEVQKAQETNRKARLRRERAERGPG